MSLAIVSDSPPPSISANRSTVVPLRAYFKAFAAVSLTNSNPVRIVCLEISPSMSPGICASNSSAPDRSISLDSSTAAARLGAAASRLSSEIIGLRRREESCARSAIGAISPDRSGCAAARLSNEMEMRARSLAIVSCNPAASLARTDSTALTVPIRDSSSSRRDSSAPSMNFLTAKPTTTATEDSKTSLAMRASTLPFCQNISRT